MNLYNYQYNTNSSSKKISNVENNIESAIRTVKKLVDEGITTALCTIASQMRYNVCPNSKLEKVEGKIEEKE